VSSPYSNRPLNLFLGTSSTLAVPRPAGGLPRGPRRLDRPGRRPRLPRSPSPAPGAMLPAFLAGAFTIVWAPSDSTRLVPRTCSYTAAAPSAFCFATWLALEAWSRRRVLLAVGGLVAATVAVLSHEAALAPLALVPLLFSRRRASRATPSRGGRPRRLRRSRRSRPPGGAAVVGGAGSSLLSDADPDGRLQAGPSGAALPGATPSARAALVERVPPGARAWPAVPWALAVFAVGLAACWRSERPSSRPRPTMPTAGSRMQSVARSWPLRPRVCSGPSWPICPSSPAPRRTGRCARSSCPRRG